MSKSGFATCCATMTSNLLLLRDGGAFRHHPVRGLAVLMPCLVTLAVLFTTSLTFAVAVGDRVEIKARNRAGVPLHAEARGAQRKSASVSRHGAEPTPRDASDLNTGSTTTHVVHQCPFGCPPGCHDPGEGG